MMIKPLFAVFLLLYLAASICSADQYTCESGTVSNDSRTAAPSYSTVGIIADKSRKTCDFEISGEKIDRNTSASTSGSTGSSGSSPNSSASKSERSQRAIQDARRTFFQSYRELNAELSQFAPLIFGTTEFPSDIVSRFDRKQLESGLRDCFRDLSPNRPEFRSLSGRGEARFRCGTTGERGSLNIDLVTTVTSGIPKLYFSFRMSEKEQFILFIPLSQ